MEKNSTASCEVIVRNRQVILREHVRGFPKELDMEVRDGSVKLKVEDGSSGAMWVKNLYLSCEPKTRHLMDTIRPGSVSTNK